MQIGDFARAVGKSVRALHLYEELGLLEPSRRTKGGFRLYGKDDAARVAWIVKLQAIGFSLTEIRSFVDEFEDAASGRAATDKVRKVFRDRLDDIHRQVAELRAVEADLHEALAYLDACTSCSPQLAPAECRACNHEGHEPDRVPVLFAGLSETAEPDAPAYDVDRAALTAGQERSSHGDQH
jgi:MerR family transcriptional regulator, copper efflux regulator